MNPSHTIFLNAGDFYQGTIWYTMLKYKPVIKLANLMNYTAFTLGNHDFDDGVDGLMPLLNQANFPVLAANVKITKLPHFREKVKPSITLNIDGTQIGIIGYITTKTANTSRAGPNVEFLPEIPAVKSECQKLRRKGVKIIIGLGHSGYQFDKLLAKEVPELDVIVGGHSHSYLYTGKSFTDTPRGDYPTYIKQRSGKVVPVVQVRYLIKIIQKRLSTF